LPVSFPVQIIYRIVSYRIVLYRKNLSTSSAAGGMCARSMMYCICSLLKFDRPILRIRPSSTQCSSAYQLKKVCTVVHEISRAMERHLPHGITQVNAPCYNPSQANQYSIYLNYKIAG